MENIKLDKNLSIACSVLLISVVEADNVIEDDELHMAREIISDYFNLNINQAEEIINSAKILFDESSDIFQFGLILNSDFNFDQKIDFILSVFEIAFVDNELHHLEQHAIRKIADILHIEHKDLIAAKLEIKKYLD